MVETIRAYARSDASVFGQQGLSERVLEAMAQTKRHLFIPKRSCSIAYADRPFPTPALRTRSNVSDVAFVEFAVDQTHADGLAELFRALGFKLMGRHRSKAVVRWSQGGINLLINISQDSLPRSHYAAHGSGVCAIALTVDDVTTMMTRADILQATTFRQPVGPGEMTIPAIRGVGGSLLYFLEPGPSNWDVDFVPVPSAGDGVFLNRVDHISQWMRFEELLSWEQFYIALFDVQRSPQLEIADPLGLVKSEVLQNRNGSLRLVLNASTATQTMSSRFLSEFFGAGVQHLARVASSGAVTFESMSHSIRRCFG
jgi:4-hydroxyphenylpyruvate dioxygenase